MKDLLILLAHLFTTAAKLLGPGGARAIDADSLFMKLQLLVIHRSRRRAPNLTARDRFLFGLDIDKDMVRRVLAKHYRPMPTDGGPSWLTLFGQAKDSLWSMDLFRCESILLKNHWVLVVMDQFTRRIIGFGVQAGNVDGVVLCRIFNTVISTQSAPHYLSSDNDPLFRYHRWQANLRIIDIRKIKSIPYAPVSHPFVERLIGTIRREYLDRVWVSNS